MLAEILGNSLKVQNLDKLNNLINKLNWNQKYWAWGVCGDMEKGKAVRKGDDHRCFTANLKVAWKRKEFAPGRLQEVQPGARNEAGWSHVLRREETGGWSELSADKSFGTEIENGRIRGNKGRRLGDAKYKEKWEKE